METKENGKPKISVIVPVYNTEKYLRECLDSLINQTLKDIEIICINDGSTDNSQNILDEYAQKDCRIKIFCQRNQGLSSARNKGIELAKGDFLGFLDSDDFALPEKYEKLYNTAIANNSDISICSFRALNAQTGEFNDDDTYLSLNVFPSNFEHRGFQPNETFDFIFRICVCAVNKIYKRELITNNNIKFPFGLIFEDNIFFMETFLTANKIAIIKEPLTVYRRFSDTSFTTDSKQDYKKLDIFKIMKLKEDVLKKRGVYKQLKEYFKKYKKGTLQYWLKKINNPKIKAIYAFRLFLEYPFG